MWGLRPAPVQDLSEVERARLRRVALFHLGRRDDLGFGIAIPTEICKRQKSLRKKFDSFSKENKERECAPKAFGVPLRQVIANDRAFKRRQDAVRESRRDCLDLEASVLRFRAREQQARSPHANPPAPAAARRPLPDAAGRGQRRGGLSVDSISDLVDSQSRLLEALQLSHPAELDLKKAEGRSQSRLSLNPVYPQVPRVLERCCGHIEAHGLRTVGIFRVGSSKKRVRQLREDFDAGVDVQLDEEHGVHDVAALLKEFLRDMPDPLLTRELYPAFLHANLLGGEEQLQYLQYLLYLLPPCNCDTLLRLLTFLHTVHTFARDAVGADRREIPGNRMTAANLAVIFGPNLLRAEPAAAAAAPRAAGVHDSTAVINVTLALMQNYSRLFTVSAELQQEVLLSLIQSDPDIIDYLLRRKLSDGDPSRDPDSAPGGSLPPSTPGGGLSGEVFLNALKMKQSHTYGEARPGKSIRHMRQFHSYHNLLSLARPCARRPPPEEGRASFWDLLAGKGSGSDASV